MAALTTILVLLSPFGLALLLTHALQQAINPSILPKSFVGRQLVYAFLLLPLIDFFARVWLLQPFVPVIALLVAGVGGASAALFWVLQKAVLVANKTATFTSSFDQVAKFTRNELISPELVQTWQNLSSPIQAVFSNVNYTQLSIDIRDYWATYQGAHEKSSTDAVIPMWRNITTNAIVREMGSNLSSIVNNSLHFVHLTDFVRNGDSVENDTLVFQKIKDNLILFVNRLSLDDANSSEAFDAMMADLRSYSSIALDGIKALGLSLVSRTKAMISNSTLPEETKQTFDEVVQVIYGGQSLGEAFHSLLEAPLAKNEQAYQMCDAYDFLRINPRWVAALFVMALMSMPLMYVARALLQTWIQWNLSKTYREVGNEAERKVDGYILTGGVTGIGFGAAQVTIHALLWGLAPSSTMVGVAVLLLHGATLMVMNCVIQMGISSAEGRRDLMRRWSGRKRWWTLATTVHVAGGAWWTAQYVGTVVCAVLGLDTVLGLMAVGDAVVIAILAWWATSICQRARRDEVNNSRQA